MSRSSLLLIGVLATVTLAVAGCTSSGDDDPTVSAPTVTSTAPSGSSSPAGGPVTPIRRHSVSTSRNVSPTTSPSPSPSTSITRTAAPFRRKPGVFTVSFAGDVHFAGRVGERLTLDPHTVFGPAAAVLGKADFTMVNLETAITTGGTPQAKEFHFRAPPVALDALRYAGVDLATMANNHGADYGASGLRDTLRAIRTHHTPVIGIGADADQAFAPYRTTLNGVKVAFFAADQVHDETTLPLFSAGTTSPGVANAYQPRLVSEVRAAKRQGYVVIVYVRWGIEYQTCPSGDQTTLASQLAQAGASAVIGTHAHVLQGAGYEPNGTFVAYGLGNYLWWMSFGNDQDDNGVLTLTFDRSRVIGDRFSASHLDGRGIPVPATGPQKQRIDAEWAGDRQCANLSSSRP